MTNNGRTDAPVPESRPTTEPAISIKQLRTIAAVADRLSLVRASEHLGMSQSSLSRQIAEAESVLGAQLFQRGWNGTEPTATGAIVIAHTRRMMSDMADAQAALQTKGARPGELAYHLTWKMLEMVEAVRTAGGASAAADYLATSQPTVSRTIGQVAAAIGAPLFQRTPGGMAAGPCVPVVTDLLARLRRAVAEMHDALAGLTGKITGRVAVGLLPFSEQEIVVQVFSNLLRAYPHLRLQAVTGSYSALTDALRRGEIDCIMGPLRGHFVAEALHETVLLDEWLTIVARKGHPRVHQGARVADLVGETWVVGPHGTPTRQFLETLFLERRLTTPLNICEMVTFPLAERMVLESDGIGLLTYSSRKRARLGQNLVPITCDFPEVVRHIGVTVQRGGAPSVPLQLFLDAIAAAISLAR